MKKIILATSLILLKSQLAFGAKADRKFDFGFQNIHQFNGNTSNNQTESANYKENQNWVNIDLLYNFDRSYFGGKADFNTRVRPDKSHLEFSLPEAYVSYTGTEGDHFDLGRKVLSWSSAERFWQLDHLNGQRSFELMDNKQEGLLGLHIKNPNGKLKSEIFISYFYIPTLNPHIDVNGDRNAYSNSGWAKLPPRWVNNNGTPVRLYYNIERPDSRKVFLQKSLAGRLSYSFTKNFLVSGYTLYKPESKLRINAVVPVSSERFENNYITADVNATADVNHHFITGGETRARLNRHLTLNAGATYIDPTAKLAGDFDSATIKSPAEDQSQISSYTKVEPKYDKEFFAYSSLIYKRNRYLIGGNLLKYLTDHNKGSDQAYSETTKWDTAAGLTFKYLVTEKLLGTYKYRYDFVRKDNILELGADWNIYKKMHTGINVQLIKAPTSESYWASYRDQDRVSTYLNYNF